jgi:hypothetical protein
VNLKRIFFNDHAGHTYEFVPGDEFTGRLNQNLDDFERDRSEHRADAVVRAAPGRPCLPISSETTPARARLQEGRLPLADIAAKLGFADQRHFTRRFAATLV